MSLSSGDWSDEGTEYVGKIPNYKSNSREKDGEVAIDAKGHAQVYKHDYS